MDVFYDSSESDPEMTVVDILVEYGNQLVVDMHVQGQNYYVNKRLVQCISTGQCRLRLKKCYS